MEPIKEDGGSGMSLPHPTCIPPLDNYFILNIGFILFYLVLDFECATPWYAITMAWSNVPCAKLPPWLFDIVNMWHGTLVRG